MYASINGVRVGGYDLPLVISGLESALGTVRADDATMPWTHGARPGLDWLEPGAVTLTVSTGAGIGWADALRLHEELAAAWRADLGAQPGQLTELTLEAGGRTRVLLGRCRRLATPIPDGVLVRQGAATTIAEFEVLVPFAFAEHWTETTITVVPRSLGGIIAPIVTPVTTLLTSGTAYRTITLTGSAPSPLQVVFHGPAKDPRLTVGGVEVGIVGDVAYDEHITIDGLTRTALTQDGRPAATRLTRSTQMHRLTLPQGVHELQLTATDRTGTAAVTVRARDAHYTL